MRDPADPWADEIAAATPTPSLTPSQAELQQRAIDACARCDRDGYRGTTVCDHQPNHAQAATRGMNHLRDVMGWTKPTTTEETP